MNKVKAIDEIDWLISEVKPGIELGAGHFESLKIAGIDWPTTTMTKLNYDMLIDMLKIRREKLDGGRQSTDCSGGFV